MLTAFSGQTTMHSAHPMHFSGLISAFSATVIASAGHHAAHVPHAMQPARTYGLVVECCSSLPARDAPPMPTFLMAPPNPDTSCPLK